MYTFHRILSITKVSVQSCHASLARGAWINVEASKFFINGIQIRSLWWKILRTFTNSRVPRSFSYMLSRKSDFMVVCLVFALESRRGASFTHGSPIFHQPLTCATPCVLTAYHTCVWHLPSNRALSVDFSLKYEVFLLLTTSPSYFFPPSSALLLFSPTCTSIL